MNPLMWYNDNFCKKCKEKTCRRTSGGVFYEDNNAKIMCMLSAVLMLELDRPKLRKMK